MGDDSENKTIRFRTQFDGNVEAADGVIKVADALNQQRLAVKAVDAAVAQSDAASRIVAYRAEADKLNATQTQTVTALKAVTAETQRASAEISQQSQAIQDSAAKFTSFGDIASRAIDGLTPSVKQLQEALAPAKKAVDDFISSETMLGELPSPSLPKLPAIQQAPATSPIPAPVAAAPSLLAPAAAPSPAPAQPALPDLSKARIDVESLTAAQAQAVATLRQFTTESQRASEQIAGEGAAAQDSASKVSELGASLTKALDTSDLKRFTADVDATTKSLTDLAARGREVTAVKLPEVPHPQISQAAPSPLQAPAPASTASLEPIATAQAQAPVIKPTVDTSAIQQGVAEQQAALAQMTAQTTAALEQLKQRFGSDSASIAKALSDGLTEGVQDGLKEALAAGTAGISSDIGPALQVVHQQLASVFGAEDGAAIAHALSESVMNGLEEGVREAIAKSGGEMPQEVSSALAQMRAQFAAFEADKTKIAADGAAVQNAQAEQATTVLVASAKSKFTGLEGDKTAITKSGQASQRAEVDRQLTEQVASATKQYTDLETTKAELIKFGLDEQTAATVASIDAQVASVHSKLEALEADKSEMIKTGLDDQRTEIEKQLGAEVDALKKRFQEANLGQALAGSGKEALAALGTEVDSLSQKLAAVKAMNQAADQSGFLSRLASYRAEAAALNAEQDNSVASFKKLAGGIKETTDAFALNTHEIRAQSRDVAEVVNVLARSFAEVVPAASQFREALDVGVGSLRGMLGLLGGGPGILLGGLVAGVGLLGSAMSAANKEAEGLAKQTEVNTKSLGDYMSQITGLRKQVGERQSANIGQAQKEQSLTTGKASGQDYAVEVESLKALIEKKDEVANELQKAYEAGDRDTVAKLASIRDAINQAPARIALLSQKGSATRADDLGQTQATKANRQDQLDYEGALAEAGGMPDSNKGKAAKPEKPEKLPDSAALDAVTRESLKKIGDLQAAYRDKEKTQDEALLKYRSDNEISSAAETLKSIQEKYALAGNDRKALVHTDLEQQREDIETQISTALDNVNSHSATQTAQVEEMRREAMRQTRDEFLQLEDEKFQAVQKHMQDEQSKRQQMTQSLMALGTTAAQLAAKQLQEAVKGHKIQGALILEGLGDAMVAEGVRVMFQGAAMALMGNFASGGGLLALGAAEIGVGLGLGAAGAAAQPPSAAGGNGASTTPASPIHDTQQGSNSDQRGPTIVYVSMPTVVSPSAEDGLRVQQAIDAASRVYGAPV